MSDEKRAAFLYDLGMAQRFDPTQLAQNPRLHFDTAQRSLEVALALHTDPLYLAAVQALASHRQSDAAVRQQYAAEQQALQENTGR